MQNGYSHLPWMTDELAATREQARRFAEKEVAPGVESWREAGHSDPQVWKKLADLGLLLPELPEEYGGSGSSLAYQLVVQEELARVEAGLGIVTVHSIAAHYILNYGTAEQKQRWLPRLASGELLAAIAMSEPGAGSDLQGVRTRAVRDGEEYVISGSKIFISGGYNAGLIIVVCKTDPSQGAKGVSLIVIETKDLPGFKVGRLLNKIGLKASDTAELFFDEVRVPATNLLGGGRRAWLLPVDAGASVRAHANRRRRRRGGGASGGDHRAIHPRAQSLRPDHLRIPEHTDETGRV